MCNNPEERSSQCLYEMYIDGLNLTEFRSNHVAMIMCVTCVSYV